MDIQQNSLDVEYTKQMVIELTSYIMHKHYCENDVESIVTLFDEQLSWFGTGEEEYAVGAEKVAEIFRRFAGVIPKCNIADEQYHVVQILPEVYLCTGRVWITTDPSTNMCLRMHQRITTVFRQVQEEVRCCHIHISTPYSEMAKNDVGFPSQMGRQLYEYLQECIDRQKKQMEAQTAMLERMSFEDFLTGMFNQNKFHHLMENYKGRDNTPLGVACFDINGLKEVNDRLGHSAGDKLICRIAEHIKKVFHGKAFRIGGDEFAVIDEEKDEDAFQTAIISVCKSIEQDGLNSAMGFCWRGSGCSIREQFEEADKRMYQEKRRFYSAREHNRRRS